MRPKLCTFVPAPEEYTDVRDFKAACVPSYERANSVFMRPPITHKFKSLSSYYYWCWKQPEATMIHEAFKKHDTPNSATD